MTKPKSPPININTILRHLLEGNKLTWEETFKAISDEKENWDDLNITLLQGLEDEQPDS